MPVEYRLLNTISDLEQFVALEIAIWGLGEREALPASVMRPLLDHGGLALGAYDGTRMVGLSFALPARFGEDWGLWSYVTGVHPDYQGQGIGFALKQQQRAWALEQGYETIRWTYDPLQRGNAHFNLHRLGAVARIYHLNYYGEMTDGINAGLPSDRVEVEWRLVNGRVEALALGKNGEGQPRQAAPGTFLLLPDTEGKPLLKTPLETRPAALYLEIPAALDKLKRARPALAYGWRIALREALLIAFDIGYVAVDFASQPDGRGWYVLRLP